MTHVPLEVVSERSDWLGREGGHDAEGAVAGARILSRAICNPRKEQQSENVTMNRTIPSTMITLIVAVGTIFSTIANAQEANQDEINPAILRPFWLGGGPLAAAPRPAPCMIRHQWG